MDTDVRIPEVANFVDARAGVLPGEFDRTLIQNLASEGGSLRVPFFAGFHSAGEPKSDYGWRGYDDSHIVLRRKEAGTGFWIVRTLTNIQVEEPAEDGSWSFRGTHNDAWVSNHENGFHTLSRVFEQETVYEIRVPPKSVIDRSVATFEVISQKKTSFVGG